MSHNTPGSALNPESGEPPLLSRKPHIAGGISSLVTHPSCVVQQNVAAETGVPPR
jgi:hypothetical protein